MSRQAGVRLAVLLASVWLVGCATAKQTEVQRLQARSAYERAVRHIADRQVGMAFRAVQEAIALDDTAPAYRSTLGVLYLQMKRPDLALVEFRHATDLDENYAEAHLNTGIALAEMARWADAVPAYRRAIGLPTLPQPYAAYQNLGLALYHLKQFREAEEALRFAINLEPGEEAAYYNLGLVFLAQGRAAEAKRAFRRVLELAPQSGFSQPARGQLKALGEGG